MASPSPRTLAASSLAVAKVMATSLSAVAMISRRFCSPTARICAASCWRAVFMRWNTAASLADGRSARLMRRSMIWMPRREALAWAATSSRACSMSALRRPEMMSVELADPSTSRRAELTIRSSRSRAVWSSPRVR